MHHRLFPRRRKNGDHSVDMASSRACPLLHQYILHEKRANSTSTCSVLVFEHTCKATWADSMGAARPSNQAVATRPLGCPAPSHRRRSSIQMNRIQVKGTTSSDGVVVLFSSFDEGRKEFLARR